VTAVPEPASALATVLGVFGLAVGFGHPDVSQTEAIRGSVALCGCSVTVRSKFHVACEYAGSVAKASPVD
jgi:hypothetical protein